MNPMRDVDPAVAEYLRRFDVLAKVAEDLHLSPDEAEGLINDVIVSSLFQRRIEDIDVWLAAALTYAVNHAAGGATC